MKSNHVPRATRAPALRAPAIPRSDSNTTRAPARRAIAEVSSVDALSQTMVSQVRLSDWFARSASPIRPSVCSRHSASFQAGITTERSTGLATASRLPHLRSNRDPYGAAWAAAASSIRAPARMFGTA